MKLKIETLEATTKEIKNKQVDVEIRINKLKGFEFENKMKSLENIVKKYETYNKIFSDKIEKLQSRVKKDKKTKRQNINALNAHMKLLLN